MDSFVLLLVSFVNSIIKLLTSKHILLFGFSVSIGSIIFGCLLISFVVGLFWKGAKA